MDKLEKALEKNREKIWAEATARGVKKISGLRFGDRIKVKEYDSDCIHDGCIIFIDHETGHVELQVWSGSLSLSGMDSWEIID